MHLEAAAAVSVFPVPVECSAMTPRLLRRCFDTLLWWGLSFTFSLWRQDGEVVLLCGLTMVTRLFAFFLPPLRLPKSSFAEAGEEGRIGGSRSDMASPRRVPASRKIDIATPLLLCAC